MAKQPVIALRLMRHPSIKYRDVKHRLDLPRGCVGIMYAFASKSAAREFWGDDVGLVQIEPDYDDNEVA